MNRGIAVLQTAALPLGYAAPEVERETGFEPATSTLARLHSTAELFPLDLFGEQRYSKKSRPSLSRGNRTCFPVLPVKFDEIIDSRPDGDGQGHPEDEHSQGMEVDSQILIVEY